MKDEVLYVKCRNLSKPDFLLIQFLLENNKLCWILTDEDLTKYLKKNKKKK